MSKGWPQVRLGEVLTERREKPEADDLLTGRIQIIGKIGFNDGQIQLRTDFTTKTGMIIVRPGDLVVSGINAAKGAIAIYDEENKEPIAGTIHYGSYIPNKKRIDIEFLWWMLRSKFFRELLLEYVPGGIKTELKANRLLPIPIPLPSLDEQQQIMARIEGLADQIEEAQTLRHQAAKEAETLLARELHRRFVAEENTWPLATVADAGEIIDPNPSHRMPRYAETGIPFISTVDFEGPEGIRRRTAKYVTDETYKEQSARCSFAIGDILYSRIGTIGEARVLTEVWPFALSHVLVVVKPKVNILPRFLLWYLRSDSIVSQAEQATRSVGVPDLGIKRIRSFHMPFPPLHEQRRIVAELDRLQAEVDALKRLQAETAAELDALLPSILDRAFKGEL